MQLFSNMPNAKSHEDFCGSICLCCLKKGSGLRIIAPVQGEHNAAFKKQIDYETLLRKHFWSEYNTGNPDLPASICDNCRKKLVKSELEEISEFLERPHYEGISKLLN